MLDQVMAKLTNFGAAVGSACLRGFKLFVIPPPLQCKAKSPKMVEKRLPLPGGV
ncbi:hypothetical protein QJS10_CPB04g01352 [Acorus calamus]|uniref:Uncharacterized protein n=1 Tax=Acorus calamus TaxID=4465 RepID=A0AAV9EYS9_ACOCL|nr:hypothetical protein QJS10_CPB04g01352 [Acorus calamus]